MTRPDKESHQGQTAGRKRPKRPPWSILFILLLILLAGSLWMAYRPGAPRRSPPVPAPVGSRPAPATTPKPTGKQEVARPEKPPATGQPSGPERSDTGTLPTAQQEIQASVAQVRSHLTPGQCEAVARRLHDFFTSLDQREYIGALGLGEPAQDYFLALGAKLLDNPPVVVRESDDLYTILTNMAHFFRVIGSRNIAIMKTIMHRERAGMEDVLADLYLWSVNDTCQSRIFPFAAPLDKVYEYAGFFLNTLGGRSYLFRRESGTRLLVNYYSVLVIDRANRQGLNRHGIDLARILPLLTRDIEATNQLIYRETYLDNLYDLGEKYPPPDPVQ